MSTRSTTHIHEMSSLDGEKIVCNFYRQGDGYPSGHGQDLADWLKNKRLVNGIGGDFVRGRDFNRAGTLAVPLMAHIQDKSGCETIPPDEAFEEYEYHIYFDEKFYIECKERYSGNVVKVAADEFDGNEIEELWSDDDDA